MSTDAEQLDGRILALIGSAGQSEPFDPLALDLFAYQYERDSFYRGYCDELGRGPGTVAGWEGIPAVWPVAWRLAELRCFDAREAVAEFLSSGTTALPGADPGSRGRSRHLFDTLDLYRAAMAQPFADALIPPGRRRVPILVLMPSPDEQPDSSLSFMMGEAIERFGRPDASGFFVHGGQFMIEQFVSAVRETAAAGEPMVLASTAFGWVVLLEALGRRQTALPAGSRIMETGGYKGRSVEWPRSVLYERLGDAFAVPAGSIVSEYGMCELSSQFYSRRTEGPGTTVPGRGVADDPPVFTGPPWVRVKAVEPESQRPVPPGEAGLLRVIDLANRGSVIAVQTEDLALVAGDGSFVLLGRAPTAAPKGCSLTAEESLSGGRGA